MKILMRADTHVSFSVPAQEPKAKCTFTQVLAALSISLGSMVTGFASAYTSTALPTMKNTTITKFIVTENQASWITSLMPLGALIGGIIGGTLIECIGRRNTLLATALPFSLSWTMIGFAKHVAMIYAARFLCGLCVGIATLTLPVYLSETIQPEVRGILGLLPTAFGNIGILICYIVGTWVNWTLLAFIGATLPIPFLVLTFLIPETPRWYISHGHKERARCALKWLRGKKVNIEPELESINLAHIESEKSAATNILKELFQIKYLKPLMISLGLMFFQQLSGINAVISYTVEIFEQSGSSIDKNTSTIIVGVVNFFATFVATTVIDRFGRKILLYVSNVSMIITLFLLSGYFFAKCYELDTTSIDWLPLGSAIIYVIGFSLGFGPIPWLMMGEILPSKVRGTAASISTSFNWACTFIVTKTYLDLNGFIGNHGVFLLFGIIEIFGLIFIIYCVPETQGRTLEDIENKMTGRTEVRRMSSIANMKPLAFNM